MPKVIIEDREQFLAYLAQQPLCRWAAQKQREIDSGLHSGSAPGQPGRQQAKNDNAELAAALSSMA